MWNMMPAVPLIIVMKQAGLLLTVSLGLIAKFLRVMHNYVDMILL